MHIVHYTSAHPWTASRIFSKMCVHLAEHGHKVELVAVDWSSKKRTIFREKNVTVHLVPGLGFQNRLARASIVSKRVTQYAVSLKADLLHFHDPELIPFLITHVSMKTPVVFDAHEDFVAQVDEKSWASRSLRMPIKAFAKLLRFIVNNRATHIIAATEGVREPYKENKSSVVRNYPILKELKKISKISLLEREKAACYIGAISEVRGLREVINAIHLSTKIKKLHLAGNFTSTDFRKELERLPGWEKVVYHGYVDREQIIEILGQVRLAFVTLHPTANHMHSIPIKLLEASVLVCQSLHQVSRCGGNSLMTELMAF